MTLDLRELVEKGARSAVVGLRVEYRDDGGRYRGEIVEVDLAIGEDGGDLRYRVLWEDGAPPAMSHPYDGGWKYEGEFGGRLTLQDGCVEDPAGGHRPPRP